ncbi:docking protein 2 [Chrysoperla carnea]|uniref:docking protein 2 n=1 Tax=Chrysoperla carnea TaxID=189513 RepID=UPI001D0721AD|nr:docking protein 2 [Chrysoperla carnea]
MNREKPVYDGNLLFPPQGKILKKSWQSKYCLLFNASKLGIERLEVYDHIDDYPKHPPHKIYTLENCIKISQTDVNIFTVITKTWCQNFGTQNPLELTKWIAAFQSVAFDKIDSSQNQSIVEDNELYSSSGAGTFTVLLCQSEASERCGLEPKIYTLVISSTSTKLKDFDTGKTLFTWPHRYIRRYGYRDGKFTFEAGRKCDSGEGSFHLKHENQQEIFRCLSLKMKSMRKMLSNDPNASTFDCADNQFHAASNMEARSRSPIPLSSPTGKSHFMFTDKPPNVKNVIKPKPAKPPRKHLPLAQPQNLDYELISPNSPNTLVDDYAKVEVRNEAWKTLGVDEVSHSESIDLDSELNEFLSSPFTKSQESLQFEPQPLPPASKVISTTSTLNNSGDDSYDKLQFFGSSTKLNEGYNKIIVTPKNGSVDTTPCSSINDYEEVSALQIDMEAVRLADDSHLGYGMIRKQQNVTKILPEETVSHEVINNTPYAIISKPKRV